MADYNPGTTAIKGLQWFPVLEPGITIDAATKAAVQSIAQSVGQSIGTIRVYVSSVPTSGLFAVEVYDNEDAVAANVSTLTARPNEDVSGTGASDWNEDDGTTSTIYDQIDESTLDLTDYIQINGGNGDYIFRVNTGALTLTSKRILAVRLVVVGRVTNKNFELGIQIGGTAYFPVPSVKIVAGSADPTTVSYTWLYNPATSLPWTIADVQAFDTTSAFGLGCPSNLYARVYQAYVEVVVCDENRIAVGAASISSTGWNAVTMTTPTGGTWTKDSSGRHLYVVRRLGASGSIVLASLSDGSAVPNPASGYSPTIEPTYGYVTAMGSSIPAVFGLIQRTTAPAESVDSQAYIDALEATVYSGRDAEQEFSNAAATTYGEVAARVKSNSAASQLDIKIRRRSDNVQLGTTVSLTKAQVDAMPAAGNGWRVVQVQLGTAATLTTGVQYYIEFSSSASGVGQDYWSVLALDTGDQGNGATFGGTTDRALVNGSEADRYDLAATLATVPSGGSLFTNFAATLASQLLAETACGVDSYDYVAMTWNPSSLGASFDHYEIERSEDGGLSWYQIAEITDEGVADFQDYEGTRGITAGYRLRVVNTSGTASAWSSTVNATPLADSAVLYLVSNEDPTLNMAVERSSEQPFTFLDAGEVVIVPLHDADYQAAFQPTEQRGVSFTLTVTLNFKDTPADEGIPVFTNLRRVATADVPYVCVLDHYGNRWLAVLQVPSGTHVEPGHRYVAQIQVTEVTATPAVITVAS